MRLIDADAIPWDVEGVGFIPVIGKDEIDEMPEAVVRCKDCKYAEFSEAGMTFCPGIIGSWVEDDWYCADGERREGDAVSVED